MVSKKETQHFMAGLATGMGKKEVLKGLPDYQQDLVYCLANFMFTKVDEAQPIKAMRKSFHLTISDVAAISGLTQGEIQAIEADEEHADDSTWHHLYYTLILKAYADVLKLEYLGTVKVAKN